MRLDKILSFFFNHTLWFQRSQEGKLDSCMCLRECNFLPLFLFLGWCGMSGGPLEGDCTPAIQCGLLLSMCVCWVGQGEEEILKQAVPQDFSLMYRITSFTVHVWSLSPIFLFALLISRCIAKEPLKHNLKPWSRIFVCMKKICFWINKTYRSTPIFWFIVKVF